MDVFYTIMLYFMAICLTASGIVSLRGHTDFINEWQKKNIKDLKGYAKALGKASLSLGVIALLMATIPLFVSVPGLGVLGFFTGFSITLLVIFSYIQIKYSGSLFRKKR